MSGQPAAGLQRSTFTTIAISVLQRLLTSGELLQGTGYSRNGTLRAVDKNRDKRRETIEVSCKDLRELCFPYRWLR